MRKGQVGGIRHNIKIGGGLQTWNINMARDPSHTPPPGGEAPCHDVNVKKKKVLLALIAWKHSVKFSILQQAVITVEMSFLPSKTWPACAV